MLRWTLRKLKSTDPLIRQSAAETLGKIGGARAVEPLIALLKTSVHEVRQSAAEALRKIGDARAVEPLIWCRDVFVLAAIQHVQVKTAG